MIIVAYVNLCISYESTRFTQIGKCKAVITSEYNIESVREWLKKNTDIETLKTA